MKFDWEVFKIKLTSRKLWLAIVSFVTMIMTARGADEGSIAQVASIIMAGASILAYIIAEGFVDSATSKDVYNSETHIYNLPPDELIQMPKYLAMQIFKGILLYEEVVTKFPTFKDDIDYELDILGWMIDRTEESKEGEL